MPELDRLDTAVADLQLVVSRADNAAARRLRVGGAEELQILRLIFREGPLRVGDIAERQSTSAATASGRVDRLKKRGMVERVRSEADRRVVVVQLTPSGELVAERSINDRRTILADVEDPDAVADAVRTVVALYLIHE